MELRYRLHQGQRSDDRCYAECFAERFRGARGRPLPQGFDLRLWPDGLDLPARWRQPRRIFVNSMSDLFHAVVPDAFVASVFETMEAADHFRHQVLSEAEQDRSPACRRVAHALAALYR